MLEMFFKNCLSLMSLEQNLCRVCKMFLFSRLIYPVCDPTSNGSTVTKCVLMSVLKCWYFSVFIIDQIDSVQEHCFHRPHWSNFLNNLIDFQYVAKEQKKSIKSSHVSKETSWGWAGPSSAKLEIGLCWSWGWAWQQSLHIVDMRSTHLANYLCFTKFSLIWVGGANQD